jgi:hypothetical protein
LICFVSPTSGDQSLLKLLIILVLAAVGAFAANEKLRREAGEWARDLSDRLMMLFLRSTSGFAVDVPDRVVEGERERRLRWRAPSTSAGGSPISR